jgi:hypothetical protein
MGMRGAIMRSAKNVLVLYYYAQPMRPAIRHHLQVLNYSPHHHRIAYVNVAHGVPLGLHRARVDVIILHTTLLGLRWTELWPLVLRRLDWVRDHPCLKIALPQDEYDHAEILDEWLYHWRVPVIFTNFGERHRRLLYPIMHDRTAFLHAFTGYIDPATAATLEDHLPPITERPVDIVYRANHLPYWFGSQGQLKHNIAEIVRGQAVPRGLRCDISTRPEDTITSDHWFRFLTNARVILGVESGSSVLDARGQVKSFIQAQLAETPDLGFEELSRRLPTNWDSYEFFAIGPRHLEAVYTKTVQVLVEGAYDGVLEPGRHYLALKRDFSNLDEVLDQVRDARLLQTIADRAYEEIYHSKRHTYIEFCRRIDDVIMQHRRTQRWAPRLPLHLATAARPRVWANRVAHWLPVGVGRRIAARINRQPF